MKKKFNLRAEDYLDTSDGKKQFNREHFAESASRYDWATIGLSLGRDRSWKRALVDSLPPVSSPRCIDVACGTGDVVFLLSDKYPEGECIGTDLTQEMIDLAVERNDRENVRFECVEMSRLPMEDSSVDILTGSYAIRNAPKLEEALLEFHRVIKPGGTVAFLDFSRPSSGFLQAVQYYLLRFWGGFWGLLLHGNPEVHGYISKSLRTFPDPKTLEEFFRASGFSVRSTRKLFGGMMVLYVLSA